MCFEHEYNIWGKNSINNYQKPFFLQFVFPVSLAKYFIHDITQSPPHFMAIISG